MLSGNSNYLQPQSTSPTAYYRTTLNPNQANIDKGFQNYKPFPSKLAPPTSYGNISSDAKIYSQSFSSSALPTYNHLNPPEQKEDYLIIPKKVELENPKAETVAETQNKKKTFFHKNQANKLNVNTNGYPQLGEIKFLNIEERKKPIKTEITTNEGQKKKNTFFKSKSPMQNRNKTQFFPQRVKNTQRVSQIPLHVSKKQEKNQFANKMDFRMSSNQKDQRKNKKNQQIQQVGHIGQSFGPKNTNLLRILKPEVFTSNFQQKPKQNLSITPKKFRPQKSPFGHQAKANNYGNFVPEKHQKPSFIGTKKSINRFHIIRMIGSSKYSQAFLCLDKKSYSIYCLKKINKQLISSSSQFLEQFIRKIRLQYSTHHPNVIQIYDFFCDSQFLYIIEEFIQGGNLRQYMNNNKNKYEYQQEYKKQSQIVQKMFNLSSALCYIHQNQNGRRSISPTVPFSPSSEPRFQSTIHGDLRPETILLSFNCCKIAPINPSKIQKTLSLVHTYICPQVIGGQVLTAKSDMWNLGLILYELCSNGRSLFKIYGKQSEHALADQIINMDFNKQISMLYHASHAIKDMIRCLLKIRPDQRMSSLEVMNSQAIKMHGIKSEQVEQERKNIRYHEIQKLRNQIRSQNMGSKDFFGHKYHQSTNLKSYENF